MDYVVLWGNDLVHDVNVLKIIHLSCCFLCVVCDCVNWEHFFNIWCGHIIIKSICSSQKKRVRKQLVIVFWRPLEFRNSSWNGKLSLFKRACHRIWRICFHRKRKEAYSLNQKQNSFPYFILFSHTLTSLNFFTHFSYKTFIFLQNYFPFLFLSQWNLTTMLKCK